MAGRKLFINNTAHRLDVTLFVRSGPDPANSAENQKFELGPHERDWVTYGDDTNIYLNGLGLVAFTGGDVVATQEFVVTTRGNSLDDKLNTNNVIEILYDDGSLLIHAMQMTNAHPLIKVTKENLQKSLQQIKQLQRI